MTESKCTHKTLRVSREQAINGNKNVPVDLIRCASCREVMGPYIPADYLDRMLDMLPALENAVNANRPR